MKSTVSTLISVTKPLGLIKLVDIRLSGIVSCPYKYQFVIFYFVSFVVFCVMIILQLF